MTNPAGQAKHEIFFRPGTREFEREVVTWFDENGKEQKLVLYMASAKTKRVIREHWRAVDETEHHQQRQRADSLLMEFKLETIRNFLNSFLPHKAGAA